MTLRNRYASAVSASLILILLTIVAINLTSMPLLVKNANVDDLPITRLVLSNVVANRPPPDGANFDMKSVIKNLDVSGSPHIGIVVSDSISISGHIEDISTPTNRSGSIRGWFSADTTASVAFVAVVYGTSVVSIAQVNKPRPDVSSALNRPRALWSGFEVQLPSNSSPNCSISLLLVLSDLTGVIKDISSQVCKR